jgi:hypothetical protein
MDIPYQTEMKILGTHFTTTIRQSAYKSWSIVTGRVRSLARDAFYRELCLDKRILYVHIYLLGTAWYRSQIISMPDVCTRQVNSAIAWYIWRGEIFRIPLSTLQRRKRQCGYWYICQLQLGRHPVAVVQNTFTYKQYTGRHNTNKTQNHTNMEGCGTCPVFARYKPAFALQLRKIMEKPQSG